jgi:hypothetical protein
MARSRPKTLRLEIVDERANGGIAVTGPRHIMELRAVQAIEKRVARCLVFARRGFEPAVVDGKMAGEAEPCRDRRNLPLAVRLHDATGHDRIGALRESLVQDEVELAQLVAAKAEPGGIFALDPQPRPAEMCGQPLHRLQRGRQIGQAEAREGSEPVG